MAAELHVTGTTMRTRRGTSSGKSRRTKKEEDREFPSIRSWWRPMTVKGNLRGESTMAVRCESARYVQLRRRTAASAAAVDS